MTKNTTNNSEHWITTLKRGAVGFKKFVVAVKTPVDESEYLLKYGVISLNTNSGLFKYRNKTIGMRQSDNLYKIIRLLMVATGNEVLYRDIAQELKLKFLPDNKNEATVSTIKSAVRDLRRRLGINAYKDKEGNPFIMTGKGIKLAFISE